MASPHVPDADSLELLLQVARQGSLGRAGAVHGLSQPAVSARIRTMESQVGFALVVRGPRGSELTRAGTLVADWASGLLAAHEVLAAGIESLREQGRSHLVVAASLTIAEHLLPTWLARFAVEHPQTAVRLHATNSEQVARDVLEGHVELGFVEGPTVARELAWRTIAHDRLVVVVAPGHPWARRRRPLVAQELAGTRLVQREPSSGTRAALALALDEALGADAPLAAPALELSSASAVRSAALAGAGPAVMSELAVTADLAAGTLVEVAVRDLDLHRRLRAVWPRAQRPRGAAADLLSLVHRSQRT